MDNVIVPQFGMVHLDDVVVHAFPSAEARRSPSLFDFFAFARPRYHSNYRSIRLPNLCIQKRRLQKMTKLWRFARTEDNP